MTDVCGVGPAPVFGLSGQIVRRRWGEAVCVAWLIQASRTCPSVAFVEALRCRSAGRGLGNAGLAPHDDRCPPRRAGCAPMARHPPGRRRPRDPPLLRSAGGQGDREEHQDPSDASDCHLSTHVGLARVTGRERQALAHLRKVRHEHGTELARHVEQAMAVGWNRSQRDWSLDLGILTSAGIRLWLPPAAQDRRGLAADTLPHHGGVVRLVATQQVE